MAWPQDPGMLSSNLSAPSLQRIWESVCILKPVENLEMVYLGLRTSFGLN